MNNSLKEIIDNYKNQIIKEDYNFDKIIIMDWVVKNFGPDLIDFIILIFKQQLQELEYKNRSYIEHQSWNATVFSTLIVENLHENYGKCGVFHNSTYPLFISLLRMYKDGEWKYNRIHPWLKEIIDDMIATDTLNQISDKEIVNWILKEREE